VTRLVGRINLGKRHRQPTNRASTLRNWRSGRIKCARLGHSASPFPMTGGARLVSQPPCLAAPLSVVHQ
jgi:hypothetical protein